MREGRGQREGPLIVRRGFLRSRHEMDYAAVAYELVVPMVVRPTRRASTESGQFGRKPLAVNQTARRLA